MPASFVTRALGQRHADMLWRVQTTGLEKGLQEGLEKGIKEERRASLQRERELVHHLVTRRFGPGTAEQLVPLLDRRSDPGSIVAIADAVIECETGEEFLRRVRDG